MSSPHIERQRSAKDALEWARAVIDPALRSAVDGLPPPMRHIAGHHFGWWDEYGEAIDANPGKALRPAMVLLSCQSVGATAESAVPAAVAVELVHNYSLLHDDVMDGDLTRRHRPTAWTVFGVNGAILAGDALLALAFDVLNAGSVNATVSTSTLSEAVQDIIHGQSSDLEFERRPDVELDDCLRMSGRKTGSLLACACALGAVEGGGHARQIARLRSFGRQLGVAFQLVDDLLGIWGDPGLTGKSVHSDLRSRKKSVPVVAALTSETEAGRQLAELYLAGTELSERELARAAELVDRSGGREWTQQYANHLFTRAMDDLRAADCAPEPGADLTALAQHITLRDH